MRPWPGLRVIWWAGVLVLALSSLAQARIVRLEISRTAPAFGGQSFGSTGVFERVVGRAYGEVDPGAPGNQLIQDIALAPRNGRGMVEYSADIEILRPADPAKSNGVLLFNVPNRGNKGALALFSAGLLTHPAASNQLASPGDGWLQRQGYTLVWFGWQADILPGGGRLTFEAPVVRNLDGSPITGLVRSEFEVRAPRPSLNLSSGWFTRNTHDSYPTASLNNQTPFADGFVPQFTVRPREDAPRTPIASSEWSF
ncbi:MAG: hypothetical protein JO212_04985, partial [Acetobacteraceae bacterium]|nr:hypothetical protein [Acetobacteraceae bacterium]